MSHLKLVPQRELTQSEKLLQAVGSFPVPPGVLQCKKCGGTTTMTTGGARIDEDGRYKRGYVVHDRVCYHCHMMGIHSFMIPDTPRIVKERKPRRLKTNKKT